MKKPKKKKEYKESFWLDVASQEDGKITGYNQACDDWQAYHNHVLSKLPTVDELELMIAYNEKYISGEYQTDDFTKKLLVRNELAKAIYKRIKGE